MADKKERDRDIVSVDFTGEQGLKKHILLQSGKKNYTQLSRYIKDVLIVHTKYSEQKKINV